MSLILTLLLSSTVTQVYGYVSPLAGDSYSESFSRERRETKDYEVRRTCAPGVAIPVTRVDTTNNLKRLRELMKAEDVSAYIIPSSDEHNSEYTAKYDKRRDWISGFDGSAGTAIVTKNKAALWTDGRYYLQAEEQLDCNWFLIKTPWDGGPNMTLWLKSELNPGSNVVADPKLIVQEDWTVWKDELRGRGINLLSKYENLIDEVWTDQYGRLPPPQAKLFSLEKKFSGKIWQEKVKDLRSVMAKNYEADGIIVSALDEVAWLFNLRGADVPFNPVFKSYALITKSVIKLYVDLNKIDDSVRKHLDSDGCTSKYCVKLVGYSKIWTDLKETLPILEKVAVTPLSSYAIYETVQSKKRMIVESPLIMMKAIKNPTEIQGMRNAHYRDSAVIIDLVSTIEEELKMGKQWDEIKAAEYLTQLRSKLENNKGESFETISAFGSNGAVMHYKPQRITNKRIDDSSLYLLDSGGQYLDGTTDITRTFHFGQPTDFQKEAYTRVLMGAIDLAKLTFPESVRDVDIDIVARRHLYEYGLDYNHGTGHGIGSFLNVHEPPTRVKNPAKLNANSLFLPGMFLSDEPGYYEDHSFGIRLETIIMVKNVTTKKNFNGARYFGFEAIALIPFEPNLIKYELLSKSMIKWLNEYNAYCREVTGEILSIRGKQRALDWLMKRTEPLTWSEKSCDVKKTTETKPQKRSSDASNSAASLSIRTFCLVIATVWLYLA